ncbi:MAG: phosphomannomutase/phosphoglucomutase [Candidatus Altiarchaeota archaeon]
MSIFRAYDIRGVYESDLTLDVAQDIGKAFGTYIGGKGTVCVGRDVRLSSPELSRALIDGINSTGVSVINVGSVPTPILYFAVYTLGVDGGVMVTGSHNPPEYNGFKMLKGKDTLYGEYIQELKGIIDEGCFMGGKGTLNEKDIVDDYVNYVAKEIKVSRKIKVVVDGGNGAGGLIASKLYGKLGCDVVELYCEPDGNFPNHHPDPTVDEYTIDLREKVKAEKADFGIGFDGDADRAGFIADDGGIIRGDQALIIFSRDILTRNPGGKIISEVKSSQGLFEDVERNGGVPIMYRTGHSFIKKKLKEEQALIAGEMSGHFFFKERWFGFDDAIYAGARMLEILSKSDDSASGILASLPKYYSTPEIRVSCPDDKKFGLVDSVTKALKDRGLNVVTVDGARVTFPDGWGLVRASNTSPKIILRFEAKTMERLEEIKELILSEVRKHPEAEIN